MSDGPQPSRKRPRINERALDRISARFARIENRLQEISRLMAECDQIMMDEVRYD
jgi:hypothetical protein